MPTLTHEKISKKIFFEKNLKKFREKATQSMPISHAGTPLQYFLPLKISCPKKAPFCDFSVFVLFYVLFRNPVLALPVMYKFLSLLGLIRFCTIICIFSELCAGRWRLSIFALYRNGRGRGICSDFVFILFILGNMIQKTEFVYYCRKKVKKSIAIKKNVVSLHRSSLTY